MLEDQIFSFLRQIHKITYCTLIYKNRAKNRAVWNSKIAARFFGANFSFSGKNRAARFFFRAVRF